MKNTGSWWKIAVAAVVFMLSGLIWIRIGIEEWPVVSRYRVLYPTFLGNEARNYSGRSMPDSLRVVWQTYLGGSQTRVGKRVLDWSGTGWTGQPTLLRDQGRDYIVIGGFDHKLRKLDAETGRTVWTYAFDDVIKGTATLAPVFKAGRDLLLILQGSRMGFNKNLESAVVPSFRAIDAEGREAWRLNVRRTQSYSRDADASALVLDSLVFFGAENGVFYVIDPDPERSVLKDGLVQPRILKEILLYEPGDDRTHKGNLVTEASPTLCGDRIYVASGSGHVYGIDRRTWDVVWRFDTGTDLDGTLAVTDDSCLILCVEKQYTKSPGGVFKLDPRRPPEQAAVWFFPTADRRFSDWEGGVVGSASVRDSFVAFRAIDGGLYLLNHRSIEPGSSARFNQRSYPRPVLLSRLQLTPAIATSLIVGDRVVTVGYDDQVRTYRIERRAAGAVLVPQDSLAIPGFFESTPLVWDGRIYVGNRNGYFYCLGE